jgi:DNA-binding PadR family transcriptional regulator
LGLEVLKRPRYDRTKVLMAKILSFLSNGKVKGQREIQRETDASPVSVNKYIHKWVADGQIKAVMVGKRRKYQITQQGMDELRSLTEEIVVRKKSRLTSRIVDMAIPTWDPKIDREQSIPPAHVTIGATKGTPNPLSLSTQRKISELLKPSASSIFNLENYVKADFLEVRFTIGSPPLSEKRERMHKGHPIP